MMPRKYYKHEVPLSVLRFVRAICGDYERREIALRSSSLDIGIRAEFARLNKAVDDALSFIDEPFRKSVRQDIAEITGFNKTSYIYINRKSYYKQKRKVIYDIAVNLNILEKQQE